MHLLSLPSEVFILVFTALDVRDLASLSATCKEALILIGNFGWSTHLQHNPRPSYSLSKAREVWNARSCARYDHVADRSWRNKELVARPLCNPWRGSRQGYLAMSQSRVIVAAGELLFSYAFATPNSGHSAPAITFEGSCALNRHHERRRDVTAITFAPDSEGDDTLLVGFDDGNLERITLRPTSREDRRRQLSFDRIVENNLAEDDNAFVRSVTRCGSAVLSLSSTGLVFLASSSAGTFSRPSSTIDINVRSWSSRLTTNFAVFGTSGSDPLTVHALEPGGTLSPTPVASLITPRLSTSAVYGISSAPPASPWGSSDRVLVSGWYDGFVRVYDLRACDTSSCHPAAPSSMSRLLPVMQMYNRWSYEPIYSVSCGGGSGAHVAAGTARHSLVSFWDVRAPKEGWSVFAPGNDASPVYDVVLESSRLFGVTQSRSFVYDFGPGVTSKTYPALSRSQTAEPLALQLNGFYVTKASHSRNLELF